MQEMLAVAERQVIDIVCVDGVARIEIGARHGGSNIVQFRAALNVALIRLFIWFSNKGMAGIMPEESMLGSSCCNSPKAGRRNWPDVVSLKFVVVAASPTASSLRPIRFTYEASSSKFPGSSR